MVVTVVEDGTKDAGRTTRALQLPPGNQGYVPHLAAMSSTNRQKGSADQMRTSWEKFVQYVGTNYGADIGNEFQNKKTYVLTEPVHTQATLARHVTREAMVRAAQANLQAAREVRWNPKDTS